MKKNRILLGAFLAHIPFYVFAQNNSRFRERLTQKNGDSWQRNTGDRPLEIFSVNKSPSLNSSKSKAIQGNRGLILSLNRKSMDEVLKTKPASLFLKIPDENGRVLFLELVRVEQPPYRVKNAKDAYVSVAGTGVHYQGLVRGHENSIVALSFNADNTVMGLIADGNRNVVIGKYGNGPEHILYQDRDLSASMPFACHVEERDKNPDEKVNWDAVANSTASASCKTVRVYFEIDYDMYTGKGNSISNTVFFLNGIFNQVSALYLADGVDMVMSEVKVWDTLDPYADVNNIELLLNEFQADLNGNFNGDIALFLSGRNSDLNGGKAYGIPLELCDKSIMCGASEIYDTYDQVPTYSWTVYIITHEMGHTLGSRHTHWCGWQGGSIDGCAGFVEADSTGNGCAKVPIPSEGGTLMSYCHLKSVGINFNLGFGPQPLAVLQYKLAHAACMPNGSSIPSPSNIQISSVQGSSANVSWDAVPGAGFYVIEYKLSSASFWAYAKSSDLNSCDLNALAFDQDYTVRVRASCSDYSSTVSFSTLPYDLTIIKPLAYTTYCKGVHIPIDFEAVNFGGGNDYFVIELSDAGGDFGNPIVLDSLYNRASGVISAYLPDTTPDGLNYKFRIKRPFGYSKPSSAFAVSGQSAVSFLTYRTTDPSESTFRLRASASGTAQLSYIVDWAENLTPTKEQIIDGLNSKGNPTLKSGSLSLSTPQAEYSKIMADLYPAREFVTFMVLDDGSVCAKPITASYLTTTEAATTYCQPALKCIESIKISNFSIPSVNLSFTNAGCSPDGYFFRDDRIYTVQKDSTYDFTLETDYYWEYLSIWLDFNHDRLFDSSETVYQSSFNASYFQDSITIPGTALAGLTRMRVKVSYNSANTSAPCQNDNTAYGEMGDFYLNIGGGCPPQNTLVSTDDDISSGIGRLYRGQKITASNDLTSNSAADMFAQESIELKPGFITEPIPARYSGPR